MTHLTLISERNELAGDAGLPRTRTRTLPPARPRVLGSLLAPAPLQTRSYAFGLYVNNRRCIIPKGGPFMRSVRDLTELVRVDGGDLGRWGGDEICDVSVRKWRNSSSGRVPTRAAYRQPSPPPPRAHLLVRVAQSSRGENQSKEPEAETGEKK